MQTYSLTNEADNDLVNIFNYSIEHFGVGVALQFYHDLNSTFDTIAATPEHYQNALRFCPHTPERLLNVTLNYRG